MVAEGEEEKSTKNLRIWHVPISVPISVLDFTADFTVSCYATELRCKWVTYAHRKLYPGIFSTTAF